MSLVIDDVLVREDPAADIVPVVFDSPHSGTVYPPDFAYLCPLPVLRQAEDTHVEALYADAPHHGITFLHALFPRSYIDANRAADDIDPAGLADAWPGPLRPTEKSALGMGLVRTQCRPGVPLYERRLTAAQVGARIERYWRPYHRELGLALDRLHGMFGAVWHVNCHSMPSLGAGPDGRPLADFVVGDRDGTSCDPAFARLVAETLAALGYKVRLNDPYKGVELVRRYADPARGRHSLQLEVDRRLYMNEETLERHEGFELLRRDLDRLMRAIADYAADQVMPRAAE
ncbi:MAG TPA: N-formylglutamate amidohydrolase [Azospirillaceae bacterium]|nr:N-formylglutamate amidohydrolase [Azospirillaceae bacterium]